MKTNLSFKLKSSDGTSCKHILDEMVILQHSTGNYWSLNATAAAILKFCKEPKSESEIMEFVSKEFEVGSRLIKEDVFNYVKMLLDNKLLEKVPLP